MRSRWVDRILLAVAAAAILGVAIGLALNAAQPPEWVEQFVAANPAWRIDRSPRANWLRVTERDTGAQVVVPESETGPYFMKRTSCDDMAAVAPPWFRKPPDESDSPAYACVRLSGPGRDVYATAYRTTLEVAEVWEEFYEPLTRDYHYYGSGGGSTSGARDERRFSDFVGYTVSSPKDGDARDARLQAFYVEGKAIVVVSFRAAAAEPRKP